MLQIRVKMMEKITSMHRILMDMEEQHMKQLLHKNMLYIERDEEREGREARKIAE